MVDLGRALGMTRRPYSDTRPWTTGQVVTIDEPGGRLEVLVDGSRQVLPRVDGLYAVGDVVLVMRDPDASGSGQVVLGPIGHTPAPPRPSTGMVTAIGSSTVTVSTSVGPVTCQAIASAVLATGDTVLLLWQPDGSTWVVGKVGLILPVPGTPGTPSLSRVDSVVTVSWSPVLNATSYQVRWSGDLGASWTEMQPTASTSVVLGQLQGSIMQVQVRALSSGGASGWSGTATSTYPPPAPSTQQVTTTIRPAWSGTYRASRSAWDRWNVDRYGGRSTLYQGSGYGSGPLVGMAAYGTQVRDLGAISVDAVTVTLRGAGLDSGPTVVSVIGTAENAQPAGGPTGVGSLASAQQPSADGVTSAALPADLRELLRTGAAGGLALVGTEYGAVLGTGSADGMVLTVTYTRAV